MTMIRALTLIVMGLFNALFCILRPEFYWNNPRLRTLRRWLGDTPVLILSLAVSLLIIGFGVHSFNRSMDERRLTEISLSMDGGNADSVARALEDFIGEYPANTTALVMLGTLEQRRAQPVRAAAAYRKALELDSGLVRPCLGLGSMAARARRLEEAEGWFRRALENDSSSAEAYTNLALLDLKRYRDRQGLVEAERAFELDQGSAEITANLAVAYHYNGRINERNLMLRAAQSLGFTDGAFLAQVFDGSMTIRDERYAPPSP